jgi:hypothetical protein
VVSVVETKWTVKQPPARFTCHLQAWRLLLLLLLLSACKKLYGCVVAAVQGACRLGFSASTRELWFGEWCQWQLHLGFIEVTVTFTFSACFFANTWLCFVIHLPGVFVCLDNVALGKVDRGLPRIRIAWRFV